jgi:uncharacterized protein (TIGR03067 family)
VSGNPEHSLVPASSDHAPVADLGRPAGGPPSNPDGRIQQGSIRLFRVAGIDVLLHWSWFFFALLRLQPADANDSFDFAHYQAQLWYVVEYVALFGFVLLHEFGHVLACRWVGGIANRIILWPLGGIALIDPPSRPFAWLWSSAAGPLVNVLLLAPTVGLWLACRAAGLESTAPDLYRLVVALAWINGYLLVFNILPIYPLDGGRVLQALLWFVMSRAASMLTAALIGLLTALGLLAWAIVAHSWAWGIMAGFGVLFCLIGIGGATGLMRALAAPRRNETACPLCGASPPVGNFWLCPRCKKPLDVFADRGVCSTCSAPQEAVACFACGRARTYREWFAEDSASAASAATPQPLPVPAAPGPPAAVAGPPPTVRQRIVWGTIFAFMALGLCGLPQAEKQPLGLIIWTVGGAVFGAANAGSMSQAFRRSDLLKKLKGTWRLVEVDGQSIPEDAAEVRRLILTPTAYGEKTGDLEDVDGSCWIDPLAEPPALTFTPKTGPDAGKPRPGIYRLEGKTLTICLACPGQPRPTSFIPQPDSQQVLVYRREGKAGA